MASCTKALDIDKVENLTFTNTVTYNGKSYEITDLDISIDENSVDETGLNDPVFYIEGRGMKLITEGSTGILETETYEFVGFSIAIPESNHGKIFNLKDNDTYGMVSFGTGTKTKVKVGIGYTETTGDVKGSGYIKTPKRTESIEIVGDDEKEIALPKTAKYYLDFERTYKDVYKLYVVYEDANGNRYELSYKGDKEL